MDSVLEEHKQGIVLRVRLSPNSSSCQVMGMMPLVGGEQALKVSVNAVPEKGKANKELIAFLAKQIHFPKSAIKIISGETDRVKKLLFSGEVDDIRKTLEKWLGEVVDAN